MYIAEYSLGTSNNHIAVHDRKLLIHKKELKKIQAKIKEKGLSIIPLKIFFTDKNLAKLEIGICRGKKVHDKRESIKKRDTERELKRFIK